MTIKLNLINKSLGGLTVIKDSRTKHGLSGTKIYKIWADMIQRCENPKSTNFKYYGSKGVTVINDWKVFNVFYEWAISSGYKEGLSIDRIDPNGDYEPNNCRWVTREKQDNNRRDTIWVDIKGERMSLKQLSKKCGINYSTLQHRYSVGDRKEKLIERTNQGVKRNGEIDRPKFIKTNNSDVEEIKWLANNTNMFQAEIASRYDISQTMVSKIKLGQLHGNVEERRPKWLKD